MMSLDQIYTGQNTGVRGNSRVAPPDAGGWEMMGLARFGEPQLRFKGRKIIGSRKTIDASLCLFADLFERRKGDYALAYGDLVSGTIQATAMVFAQPTDAAAHLERLCAAQNQSYSWAEDNALSLADLQLRLWFRQQFAAFVGDALAQWDTIGVI